MTNYYVSGKELEQMNEKNNTLSNSNVYPNSTNLTSTLNNSSQNYTFQNDTIPYVSENVTTPNTLINPSKFYSLFHLNSRICKSILIKK